jgi:SAM-dependent methyltransferase
MTADAQIDLGDRLSRLFEHLGVQRANFATNFPQPVEELLARRPETVCGTPLIRQAGLDVERWRQRGSQLIVFYGNGQPGAGLSAVRRSLSEIPDATAVVLEGYANFAWSDVVADRTEEIAAALFPFLDTCAEHCQLPSLSLPEEEGEVAGLTYRIRGSGPPLVLLPIFLATTQWDALLPRLAERYCTISVGGRHVGVVALLEDRGSSWGYQKLLGSFVDELDVRPGDSLLEVGSGTRIVCRWLATRTGGQNAITGVDVSPYLVHEAEVMAAQAGLTDRISFRVGNAESLPFADASFDVTLSVTVMEEVDANRMMAELVRVTRPGGRVGVVVRAIDMSHWYNVDLPLELKTRIEQNSRGGAGPLGCADRSLYQRFLRTGLEDLKLWPELATFYPGAEVQGFWRGTCGGISSTLATDEAVQWREAIDRAQAEGGLLWTTTYHCAVGTEPFKGHARPNPTSSVGPRDA